MQTTKQALKNLIINEVEKREIREIKKLLSPMQVKLLNKHLIIGRDGSTSFQRMTEEQYNYLKYVTQKK